MKGTKTRPFLIVALVFGTMSDAVELGRAQVQQSQKTEKLARLGDVEVGKQMPWFAASVAQEPSRIINTTKLLKEPASKSIVLVFFATWCKPCANGLRILKSGLKSIKEAGARVLLVDVREEADVVVPFIEKAGLSDFETLLDTFGVNAKMFGVAKNQDKSEELLLPKTFIIDKEGKVLAILGAEGEDYLNAILSAGL